MTAFFDAFRFARKKPTKNSSSEESITTAIQNNRYTELMKGYPYEESRDEPQPTFGPPFGSFNQLNEALPEGEDGLLQHLGELRNDVLGPPLVDTVEPAYTITDDYVIFTRDCGSFLESTKLYSKALKMKTELFYTNSVRFAAERNKRVADLERDISCEYRMSDARKRRLAQRHYEQENEYLRLRRARLCADDFRIIRVIGRGAYGEVCLVQKKDNAKIYAMKSMQKFKMGENDLPHVKSERDVMADCDSPWIVNLYYSFQDATKLYLIMEFLPGGDMMTMLIKYEIFTEDVTRFYIAQIVLAIEAVHNMGFIHRDIKPDNILLDKEGNIKLSDFGLSTGFRKTHNVHYYQKLLQRASKMPKLAENQLKGRNTVMVDNIHLTLSNRGQINTVRKSRRAMAYSTVGTPDYIAPEVLQREGYTKDCDWWSMGAIMYECLVGWPPFCADDQQTTTWKIANFNDHFEIPDMLPISIEAEHLIRSLITSADQRLGRHGAAEIKGHPFFRGVDWDNMRTLEAPFKPSLNSIEDTSNFPSESELDAAHPPPREPKLPTISPDGKKDEDDPSLQFIGYTYKRYSFPIL